MKIADVMSSLQHTIRKLNAVSLTDDLTKEAKEQISGEVEALDWTINYVKNNMTRVIMIVGHPDFVHPITQEITKLKRFQVTELDQNMDYISIHSSEDLVSCIVLGATDKVLEICHEAYNPDDLSGNLLPQEVMLDYIICHRYYGATDTEKEGEARRILFFNISARDEYLSRSQELASWAKTIFNNVNWSDPDPVDDSQQ